MFYTGLPESDELRKLTWHTTMLVDNDDIRDVIGSTSLHQLCRFIVATVDSLTVRNDQLYLLQVQKQ